MHVNPPGRDESPWSDSYRLANRALARRNLRFGLSLSLIGSTCVLAIWLTFRLDFVASIPDAPSPSGNPSAASLDALMAAGHRIHTSLLLQIVDSALLWVAGPVIATGVACGIAAYRIGLRLRHRLLNTTALRRYFVAETLDGLPVLGWLAPRALLYILLLAAVATPVGLLLPQPWLAFTLTAFMALGIALVFAVVKQADAKGPRIRRSIPQNYAWRSSVLGLAKVALTCASAAAVVASAALAADYWQRTVLQRAVEEWERERTAWELEAIAALKAGTGRDEDLHATIDGSRVFSGFIHDHVVGDPWFTLDVSAMSVISSTLLLLAAFAYVGVGYALFRMDFRKAFLPMVIAIPITAILTVLIEAVSQLLLGAGVSRFVVLVGAVLIAFVLGQLSVLAMRQILSKEPECPVCGMPVLAPFPCTACGARPDRIRTTGIIGNTATRIAHHPECHALHRTPNDSREILNDIETALVIGYRTCNLCIGGGEYWRELRSQFDQSELARSDPT